MNNRGLENLCNAVILLAVKDYRCALANKDQCAIQYMEKFFRSDWYKCMTKVDEEFLITNIRKEFDLS